MRYIIQRERAYTCHKKRGHASFCLCVCVGKRGTTEWKFARLEEYGIVRIGWQKKKPKTLEYKRYCTQIDDQTTTGAQSGANDKYFIVIISG